MKRVIILITIFIFSFLSTAGAQTSIKAEVDKTGLTTDETLIYKIIVMSSEKKLPAPVAPKFEGFQVISQAQSSTVSYIKNNIKTILVYVFILAPVATGKLKIDPSVIKAKDKDYSTEAFEIEVTQGKVRPKVRPKQKPLTPQESEPEKSTQPTQIII